MQQSSDLKSCRASFSTQKQYASVNEVPKSMVMSQSNTKVLQRYFYKRQSSNNQKLDQIALRKSKIINVNSVHKYNTKSAKKSTLTNGNEDSKDVQIVELPLFNLEKLQKVPSECQKTPSRLQFLQNQSLKVNMRRTSDWTVIYSKNTRAYSKTKNYMQSQEIKLKIVKNQKNEHKNPKQKYSNIDLVLKKHKAGSVKQIQQRLRSTMSRIGSNRDAYRLLSMKDYSRKCGYEEYSKVFIWNSQDEHIRRILLKWGWVQNNTQQSPFFHLKWTNMPLFTDIRISERQYINHFKNTFQITSKNLLTKNLKNSQSAYGSIDNYYPKCFDVGNSSQWNEFIQEYRHNLMIILLKKVYRLFQQKQPNKMEQYDLFYGYHFGKDPYGSERNISKKQKSKSPLRKDKGFRQINMENYKNRDNKFVVQVHLVVEALRYWRNLRKQKEQYLDQGYHFLSFNKCNYTNNFSLFQKYALMDDIGVPTQKQSFTKQMFSTPSQLLLQRVAKQYQFFKCTNNLFQTYGQNNIWIVKPISTSRGSGIFLTTDLFQIHSSLKQIQSRLVQKYIEKPLLIKNEQWSELCMRKFDIRQWVLLKSIEPLQIYMFSECYLRLCYDKYKVKEIQQLYRHLTNYSINKLKFKNKQQSVLPLSYFKNLLQNQYNLTWQEAIKPKIESIIIKSIKSCVQNLQDCGGNCFELFGYDILIDEEFNPWLLQINMSPACEQRTPWLSDYLNDMSTGLLKLILPPELLSSQIDESQYFWELIAIQQSHFNRKRQIQIGLEIVGTRVMLPQQNKIDKFLFQNKMALKIQRFFKKYLPKYISYKLQMKKSQETLSKYLTAFANIFELKQKKSNYYVKSIESYIKSPLHYLYLKQNLEAKNSALISKYITAIIYVNRYREDEDQYKGNVLLHLAMSIRIKRELHKYCSQMRDIGQKVCQIQDKCRQFLKLRNERKQLFQKYFKTITTLKKYQKIEKSLNDAKNIKIIERYLKTPAKTAKYEIKVQIYHQTILSKYLKSLICRKQYFTNKLNIFYYLVGRVTRVSRRRARCIYLKQMITNWQQQRQTTNLNTVESYLLALLAFTKYKSENNQNVQKIEEVVQKARRSGSIKRIKR